MIINCNHRIVGKLPNTEIIERFGLMIGNRSSLFKKNDKIALQNLKNIIEKKLIISQPHY